MVAINEILLPECTGEECGGDNDICTNSRVHRGNAENRAPITRNHRSAPILGHWMEQDPAQYINGANTYQFVDSSPVGNVDAEGLAVAINAIKVLAASTLNVDFIGPSDKYTLGGVPERESRIKSTETSISGVGGWKAWTPALGWLAKPREPVTSGKHVGYCWFNSAQITASLVAALGEDGPMLVNPVISAAGQGNDEKVTL